MPKLRRSHRADPRRGRPVLPPARPTAARLAAGRTVIAAGILAAPVPAARLLGADSATAGRVTWLTRMMGIRDGALGVGTLDALRRRNGTGAWLVGAAVADGVDALVVASAIKQGRMRGIVPAGIVVGAGGSAVLHLVTAVRTRRS